MAAVAFVEGRRPPRFIRPLIEEAVSRSPKQCASSRKALLSKTHHLSPTRHLQEIKKASPIFVETLSACPGQLKKCLAGLVPHLVNL